MTAPTDVAGSDRPDQLSLPAHDVDVLSQGEGGSTSTARTEPSRGPAPSGHTALALESGDAAPVTSQGVQAGAAPLVLGLDLSLTSTGIAGRTWAETLTTWSLPDGSPRVEHWKRMRAMRTRLLPYVDAADLVVMEGPAYSKGADPGAHERAWLWWAIYGRCISRDIPFAEVSTGSLKVYATGGGRASKEDVVQQVQRRRPDVTFRGNDQADALVLSAMGLDHLGHAPVVMPQTHRRALDSVQWPAMPVTS